MRTSRARAPRDPLGGESPFFFFFSLRGARRSRVDFALAITTARRRRVLFLAETRAALLVSSLTRAAAGRWDIQRPRSIQLPPCTVRPRFFCPPRPTRRAGRATDDDGRRGVATPGARERARDKATAAAARIARKSRVPGRGPGETSRKRLDTASSIRTPRTVLRHRRYSPRRSTRRTAGVPCEL